MSPKRSNLSVLAIGGLDPSAHAGLLADVRVFTELGLAHHVAVTALTAQSENKFYAWKPVDLGLFRQELAASGPRIAGVKIGMLATAGHVQEIRRFLQQRRPRWVLWDPVWRSSTGAKLFRGSVEKFLSLLPSVDVWTPNLPEAELFLKRSIRSRTDAQAAALELWKLGRKKARLVVLKGGHMAEKNSTDWLVEAGRVRELKAKRLPLSPRGTGCAFGSALLAGLIQGKDAWAATRFAKHYVRRKLFLG